MHLLILISWIELKKRLKTQYFKKIQLHNSKKKILILYDFFKKFIVNSITG